MRVVLAPIFVLVFLTSAVLTGQSLYAEEQPTVAPAVPASAVPAPQPTDAASAPAAAVPSAAALATPPTDTSVKASAPAPVADPNAVVENGKTVGFDYWLTVDGKEIENSEKLGPIEYVHGKGDVIPGLEKNLTGMKAGEEKSFKVSVEEGYGQIDSKAVQEVPKTLVPSDIDLKVGTLLEMNDDQGDVFPATVMEINDDKVKLDFNHPLAGKELDFKVKIVSIK